MNASPGAALLLGAVEITRIWPIFIPIAFGFLAVYLLLPRPQPLPPMLGWLSVLMAFLLTAVFLLRSGSVDAGALFFYAFSLIALVAALCLVTLRNPVYAALSFALLCSARVDCSCCRAPFLMATIDAQTPIIVRSPRDLGRKGLDADDRSREPFLSVDRIAFASGTGLACARGFGEMIRSYSGAFRYSHCAGPRPGTAGLPANVAYLGRALFTDTRGGVVERFFWPRRSAPS